MTSVRLAFWDQKQNKISVNNSRKYHLSESHPIGLFSHARLSVSILHLSNTAKPNIKRLIFMFPIIRIFSCLPSATTLLSDWVIRFRKWLRDFQWWRFSELVYLLLTLNTKICVQWTYTTCTKEMIKQKNERKGLATTLTV